MPAALAILTFSLCYALTRAFAASGAFEYLDVLFDTDAAWFLQGFADGSGTGTGWGARSMVHPNVANLINPPVRVAGWLCSAVGVCDGSPATARMALALLVSPAAAALEVLLVFLAIRHLTGSTLRATLAAMLNLVLLPTLLFGAIPESFALTGCAFAFVFYLASRHAAGDRIHEAWWVLAGVAVTSLTLPNVWLFALAFIVTHAGGRWWTWRAVGDALRVSMIALAGTGGLALLIGVAGYRAQADYLTGVEQLAEVRAPRDDVREGRWLDAAGQAVHVAARRSVIDVPKVMGASVMPPRAALVGEGPLVPRVQPISRPPLQANFRDAGAGWGTLLTLVALVAAAIAGLLTTGPRRVVYQAAVALVAGNWVVHSIFGVELFLYAKHWSVPLAIALSAWLEVRRPFAAAGLAVVAALVAIAAARDLDVLTHILAALRP